MRISRPVLLALWLGLGGSLEAGCPQAWKVQDWQPPKFLWAGVKAEVPVEIANTSLEAWSEPQGDRLSYHWRLPDGSMLVRDGDRTSFPAQVLPGESARVNLRLRPPRQPGRYLLELAMVREQVCWYPVPQAGVYLVPVRVLPLQPLYAGSVFLAGWGLWLASRKWQNPGWLFSSLPVVWLGAVLWALARLFALSDKSQGGSGFDLVVLSSICALIWPLLLIPERLRAVLVALAGLWACFVAFADCLYLRFFGSIIPLSAWRGASQVGQVWESARALMTANDLWFAVVAGGCLAFFFWPKARQEGPRMLRAWVVLGLLGVGAYPTLAKVWQFTHSSLGGQVFSLQQRAQEFGLWGAHIFDALRTGREFFRQGLDAEEKAKVKAFFAQQAAAPSTPSTHFGVVKGANLILIQVESLQNFVINLSVNGQEITPFLNRLTKEGLYFSWVFDQTNQGRSSDGEFITLNSLHSLAEGAVVFRAANNRFLALPEILKRHGYHTLSAHPFDRGFWNRALLHPRYGFARSFFKRELGPGEIIGWGLADGAFFARMVPILRQTPEPFFAFLITLGLHHPFDAFPTARKALQLPDLGDEALANYLQAMRYFDTSLAQFFADLSKTGLLSRTVVALYGDHEAGFPLQAPLANLLGIGFSPGRLVWLRRVPFFVVTPHPELAGEIPELGGHMDIAPTLLYLLGVSRPPSFVGQALVPGRGAAVALGDGSAVDAHHYWNAPWAQCEDRASFAPLPAEACQHLRATAQEQLWASRMVLLHDLVPELSP